MELTIYEQPSQYVEMITGFLVLEGSKCFFPHKQGFSTRVGTSQSDSFSCFVLQNDHQVCLVVGLHSPKILPTFDFYFGLCEWVRLIDVIIPISETERRNEGLKASGSVLGAGTAARAPRTRELPKCRLVGTSTPRNVLCLHLCP